MGIDRNQNAERRERLRKRNEAIQQMYVKLSSKRYKHYQLYTDKAIFQMIADKYFLSLKTVEDVICGRHHLKSDD